MNYKSAKRTINGCQDKKHALRMAACYPAYWLSLSMYIENNFPS